MSARGWSLAVVGCLWTFAAPGRADRPVNCSELQGDRWYECLGAVGGRAGLVAELRSDDGDEVVEAARWAGRLGYTEAVEQLRALLREPPADNSPWAIGPVAEALAELDDRAATARLVETARRMEDDAYQVWEETIRALRSLGGSDAVGYARDLADRMTDFGSAWAENAIPEFLPILLEADARDVLPTLREWTTDHGNEMNEFLYAELMGARIRLGDLELLDEARADLGTPNAFVPPRPEYYVAALGADAKDIPALLRMASSTSPEAREAYNAIDRLAEALANRKKSAGDGPSAALRIRDAERAQSELVEGLRALTEYREDREGVQFEARMLARHHASLARLGDESSQERLVELIGDDIQTVIPWVAAQHALQLGLSGTQGAVKELVARGTRVGSPTELYQARIDFLDAAAAAGGADEPSWSVMLLDPNTLTRWRAIHHLARLRPTGACQAVTEAAPGADHDAIEDALPALTVLDAACAPQLEALARERKACEIARLTSVEVLAMLHDDSVPELVRSMRPITHRQLALDRAEQIYQHTATDR